MNAEQDQVNEFIIPTGFKTKISSSLSWPTGAMELTKALADVPQLKELEVWFSDSFEIRQQGKWPAVFPAIEVRYARHRNVPGFNTGWCLVVRPVPRNVKSEISEALRKHGFKLIADWLIIHASLSKQDGNSFFKGVWSSELKELTFGTRDYILPQVVKRK